MFGLAPSCGRRWGALEQQRPRPTSERRNNGIGPLGATAAGGARWDVRLAGSFRGSSSAPHVEITGQPITRAARAPRFGGVRQPPAVLSTLSSIAQLAGRGDKKQTAEHTTPAHVLLRSLGQPWATLDRRRLRSSTVARGLSGRMLAWSVGRLSSARKPLLALSVDGDRLNRAA